MPNASRRDANAPHLFTTTLVTLSSLHLINPTLYAFFKMVSPAAGIAILVVVLFAAWGYVMYWGFGQIKDWVSFVSRTSFEQALILLLIGSKNVSNTYISSYIICRVLTTSRAVAKSQYMARRRAERLAAASNV